MRNKRRYTSVKPGRGPSFMGGIGSVIAIIFGIFWTAIAFQMTRMSPFGGPASLFPFFGILFILGGIANAIYNFKNATSRDRYSIVDVTDSESEPDPLNEAFGQTADAGIEDDHVNADEQGKIAESDQADKRFCPYCGKQITSGFRFCPSCGKELPE